MFLHAFDTVWGLHIDTVSIRILISYMFGRSVCRLFRLDYSCYRWIASTLALFVFLLVEFVLPVDTVNALSTADIVFIVFTSVTFVAESLVLGIRIERKKPEAFAIFITASLLLSGAIALKFLGQDDPVLCDPSSVWQYHAGWHACSAFSIFFFFVYYGITDINY